MQAATFASARCLLHPMRCSGLHLHTISNNLSNNAKVRYGTSADGAASSLDMYSSACTRSTSMEIELMSTGVKMAACT
ncbi:hypothetical protein AB1Y20_009809 [Prymnesium parvum]|uniref:Uncharacterized protein n=1 Tax=Prymnesium parvum TaxID=97485 RepID=A0AB34K1G7_PRYPA